MHMGRDNLAVIWIVSLLVSFLSVRGMNSAVPGIVGATLVVALKMALTSVIDIARP